MKNNSRPNILFAIADDASHFGIYGHSWVKTPIFDSIANEGILFNNAFTTNPKCAPSRASILTGLHTWQNREACQHWNYWPKDLSVYTDLMMQAGYHTGFTGKGWAPGSLEKCERNDNPAGKEWNRHKLNPPEGSQISDKDYAANFSDFLAAKSDDQPFCFWYGGHEPHRQYNPGEGQKHGKNIKDVDYIPPYWPQEDLVRADMTDYAFEIEWFDSQLGKMIKLLEEKGELDNTLVVVTSDNGAPFPRVKGNMYEDDFNLPMAVMWKNKIEPGQISDALCSFIDLAPTFLEAADITIPADMEGKSLFDIFDGKHDPEERNAVYMGRERHDVGREDDLGYPVRCIRTDEYLYIRNMEPDRWPACNPETGYPGCDGSPTKKRILELKDLGEEKYWKLCFDKRPLEELYNIKEDPHCMENLAGGSDYRQLKSDLWDRLKSKLIETNDPRIEGKGDWFEQVEYVNEAGHSWKKYKDGTFTPQKH